MEINFLMGIPTMKTANAKEAQALEKGGNNYVTTVEDTTKEDYLTYLSLLEEYGFEKYADNGGEGLGGTVFCTTFKRDNLVLTVTYYALQNQTSISFYTGPVSEHLVYQDSYVADNKKDAKTKLYMTEIFRFGNSFVFQLKNGHFIISDGGLPVDLPYLLDFLESLTPEGEKPVIEAWVISHGHIDHCGALLALLDHADWRERFFCEGIYFSEPSEAVMKRCGGMIETARMKWLAKCLKTSTGETTNFYRPQTGQRYYFNDITMDILLCQEQVPMEAFKGDLNTSSTVCLFTIEGQKCFFSGDIHQDGLKFIMDNYTRDFLQLDVFTLNHHGFNTSVSFTDYMTVKTVLVTLNDALPISKIRETKRLISKAEESMMWGDGTKILTFPYKVSSYECLPKKEWIYNPGEKRLVQPNIYAYHSRRLRLSGFVLDADTVLFNGTQLESDILGFLKLLQENNIQHLSVYSVMMTTAELTEAMKQAGIADRFELIMGKDHLNADDPYTDAFLKSEEKYQLSNYHKMAILCCNLEAVRAAVADGYLTIVVKHGKEVDEEFSVKGWMCMDSLDQLLETPLRECMAPTYIMLE